MKDQEMCCGGTCVRAVCEYHRVHEREYSGHTHCGVSVPARDAPRSEWDAFHAAVELRLASRETARLAFANGFGIAFVKGRNEWGILSECGHYVQIWRNGRLVDEVPA